VRSPAELREFYLQRAQATLAASERALRSGNAPLAIQNWTQSVGNYLFRALVAQRSGRADPRPDLVSTAEVSEIAVGYLRSTDPGPHRSAFDPIPGAYAAILVGRPDAMVIEELGGYSRGPLPRGVQPARALDAWLIRALTGRGAPQARAVAADLKGRKRLGLLSDSFVTYFDLLAVDTAHVEAAESLTRVAIQNFKRRRDDSFFGGGVHYEGGDDYNDVVVDFRLCSIWRVRGWTPSSLDAEERQHVAMPGMLNPEAH
jgi:hypothetical protein